MASSRFFLILLLFFTFSLKAQPTGRLIKMLRESPVFTRPSAKSKILADVDKDTVFILLRASKKKSWLLVEDEAGNRGWVPADRSDYSQESLKKEMEKRLKAIDKENKQGPDKTQREVEIKRQDSRKNWVAQNLRNELSLLGRCSPNDPRGNWAGGLGYTIFLPGRSLKRSGLQLGLLAHPNTSSSLGWTLPLRFLLHSPYGRYLRGGPDLGLLWQKIDPEEADWSLDLGFSMGFALFESSARNRLRLGLSIFSGTRLSLEYQVGWSF